MSLNSCFLNLKGWKSISLTLLHPGRPTLIPHPWLSLENNPVHVSLGIFHQNTQSQLYLSFQTSFLSNLSVSVQGLTTHLGPKLKYPNHLHLLSPFPSHKRGPIDCLHLPCSHIYPFLFKSFSDFIWWGNDLLGGLPTSGGALYQFSQKVRSIFTKYNLHPNHWPINNSSNTHSSEPCWLSFQQPSSCQ